MPEARSAPPGALTRSRPWPLGTTLAAILVFAADRATKFWISHSLALGQQLWPQSPVHIYFTENSGAAFSVLPNFDWLFLAVATVLVVAVVWRWRALARESWWLQAGVGLLIGGALSNALDRLLQGYVVDFIQLPRFPVFNVADSGITVGVLILVVRIVLVNRSLG